MLALGVERPRADYIRTIGLFRTKARNLIETCRMLIERHGGEVPRSAARPCRPCPAWAARPPTWCSTWPSAKPTIAVDTHVFRVANRTGLAPGRTPLEVETGLLRRVPERYRVDAHHWLILHGRYVCLARTPAVRALQRAPLLRPRTRRAVPN